ncbi:MAG: hypothetical protein DNFNHJIP_00236 [Candidatus Argoarchaeum ethanivorans]|uniref:DUF8060 domain-containing protein n=1 Tax=Candidatus Argoarchaeum ethanivorans TaxID=2608793 RepID=A0A812A204_9EURY|nr:MAG: hypothetical protein DNFNHJIP_00236 [Candidatus Argoarchaeum ethanivorans]
MADNLQKTLRLAIAGILIFLLLIATLTLYFSMMRTISTLFDYSYESIVEVGFALTVIAITMILLKRIMKIEE